MRKSWIAVFLVLLGWVATGQVSGQVSVSPSPGANPGPAHQAPVPVPIVVVKRGGVTIHKVDPNNASVGAGIDFVNARSLPLPAAAPRSQLQAHYDLVNALQAAPQLPGPGGFSPGFEGDGHTSPVNLGAPAPPVSGGEGVTPEEAGTNNHPFTTARADLSDFTTTNAYPYRASGKLFFNIGSNSFICSASLIQPGIVVTAAHCVAKFGTNQFYSNWNFVPAYSNGIAPFGVWTATSAMILTAYLDGTDSCAIPGVVCQDDVAVLILNPSSAGVYPGTATGWYAYGYGSFGFSASGLTQITQLGYAECLDNGAVMERNDSYGYTSAANANNLVIGSLMCGGASGGPWVVNFGVRPALSATSPGTPADANVVVGVTSWGYSTSLPKEMGAAPFTSANIVTLVNAGCGAAPAACR